MYICPLSGYGKQLCEVALIPLVSRMLFSQVVSLWPPQSQGSPLHFVTPTVSVKPWNATLCSPANETNPVSFSLSAWVTDTSFQSELQDKLMVCRAFLLQAGKLVCICVVRALNFLLPSFILCMCSSVCQLEKGQLFFSCGGQFFFFYHVGLRHWTLIVRVESQFLYLLSHLSGLGFPLSIFLELWLSVYVFLSFEKIRYKKSEGHCIDQLSKCFITT